MPTMCWLSKPVREDLRFFVQETGFALAGFTNLRAENAEARTPGDVTVIEAVVTPSGDAVGSSAKSLQLSTAHGVNLIAVSRQGTRIFAQLNSVEPQAGDVLLLEGKTDQVLAALPQLGLLPLAEREIRVGQPRRLIISYCRIRRRSDAYGFQCTASPDCAPVCRCCAPCGQVSHPSGRL